MNIIWFVSGIYQKNDTLTSDLASVRLRCIEPAYAMREAGHDTNVRIIALDSNVKLTDQDFKDCDLVVFGKVFNDLKPLYEYISKLGIPIAADICDDILSLPHLTEAYSSLLRFASSILVSTVPLGEKLAQRFPGKEIYLLHDFVEGEKKSPRDIDFEKEELKFGWFGQGNNLPALTDWLRELERLQPKGKVSVVTREDNFSLTWLSNIKERLSSLSVELIPWSIKAQNELLDTSDLILIPSTQEESKVVKTANRLVTAVWAGTPVIAYPLPSYEDFADQLPVTESLSEGVQWWKAQVSSKASIEIAQGRVIELYGRKTLADDWFETLALCTRVKTVSEELKLGSTDPIRLNLGCGDKILPGFVNVDLVDERAGNKPDVQCDIRDLHVFSDNYADEVMTVHVIEHFYYWEAAEVLKEWVRVLKKGGKMIIECPNLLSACEEVLKNPDGATGPGPEGQRTMWVFYGDPQWKDPLMCHKWLYTPKSLAKLMTECGLTEIRQEPAQFKLREPRDMRLVGVKA